jgi:hypothetical protein
MQTLHIRKFKARYRLPASARDERQRLDAALKITMDETLDSELDRLGFSEDEEVCIRDVFVPIRLRLSATVDALAKAWGFALARAIGRAASGGRVAGVVRYESRLQALIDMAVGVALGDLGRVWAWRQLGLWQAGERVTDAEALDELVRALANEPVKIVAVVSTIARDGVLNRLAPRLTHEHWHTLAGAALSVAGISELLNQSMMPLAPVSVATMREASRLVSTSRIAHANASTLAQFSTHHAEEAQRAVAVLAILESNQSALARGETEARLLVNAVMLALRSIASAGSIRRGKEGVDVWETLRDDVWTRASAEFENRQEANDESASVTRTAPDTSRAADASKQETRQGTDGQENIFDISTLDTATLDTATLNAVTLDATTPDATTFDAHTVDATTFDAATSDDERPLPVVRRRAFTRFGGLLFLLGLMEDLGLPLEMSDYAAMSERPFRWVLHRVALELTSAAADDAAALAFAGLLPDAAPPSQGEDEPSESEAGVIAAYAARITEELKVRLSDWRDVPPATLLHFVCRRRAEIVADPGWFEVRFSLDDVATEIRRAGLDLDAGYLRWLGAVVKFIYE